MLKLEPLGMNILHTTAKWKLIKLLSNTAEVVNTLYRIKLLSHCKVDTDVLLFWLLCTKKVLILYLKYQYFLTWTNGIWIFVWMIAWFKYSIVCIVDHRNFIIHFYCNHHSDHFSNCTRFSASYPSLIASFHDALLLTKIPYFYQKCQKTECFLSKVANYETRKQQL